MEPAIEYVILSVQDSYYLNDTLIFKYRLEYLEFDPRAPGAEALNKKMYRDVLDRQAYAINTIYGDAVQAYLRGGEALPYEYMSKIYVTMNQDNIFSSYEEEYVFNGGAHGNTTLTSFTYDTQTGEIRTLCSFMQKSSCLTCISNNIIEQIKDSENESDYFPNYAQLIPQSFEAQDFYVTPEGVVIYFGLYEIGPYVLGIQKFTVPFDAC